MHSESLCSTYVSAQSTKTKGVLIVFISVKRRLLPAMPCWQHLRCYFGVIAHSVVELGMTCSGISKHMIPGIQHTQSTKRMPLFNQRLQVCIVDINVKKSPQHVRPKTSSKVIFARCACVVEMYQAPCFVAFSRGEGGCGVLVLTSSKDVQFFNNCLG